MEFLLELLSFHQTELALTQKVAPDCSHAMRLQLHLKFNFKKLAVLILLFKKFIYDLDDLP